MMVQFGFYALSAIAFAMVVMLLKYASNSKKLTTGYLIVGLVWLAYLVVLSRMDVLSDFSLPPRVPLLIVIPSIVAIIFFTGRSSFKGVLVTTPVHIPVFLISFRIVVELLIYGAYRDGIFPQRVTFEGLNFDLAYCIAPGIVANGIFICLHILPHRLCSHNR